MAGSLPKPPLPTLAAGSSSSPKPPPPTFPVHPSDRELIVSYLRPRVVTGTKPGFIHEADLYSAHPDLLTGNPDYPAATSSNGERAWYFFTPLRQKASAKNRMKRNVDNGREGSWVSSGGGPNDVFSNGQRLVGQRLGFQFMEKVDGKRAPSSPWRMTEFRLDPKEGGQEVDSPDLVVLSKVYLSRRNPKAEDESSMTGPARKKRKAGDENSGAKTVASSPGRQKKTDGEIESVDAGTAGKIFADSKDPLPLDAAEKTAVVPGRKRKADKDSGAETVASSPGRQKKTDGEIEGADAATTAEIFADNEGPLDAAEKAEQEQPGVPRIRQFYNFLGDSSAPLDAPEEAQESRDPRDPQFFDFLSDSQNPKKQ